MSFEEAIIAQAKPFIARSRIQHLIGEEISKGCLPDLHPTPLELEPPYRCLHQELAQYRNTSSVALPPRTSTTTPSRHQIWISPKQSFNWNRAELFIKQLASIKRPIGFEISGNRTGIELSILAHPVDIPPIQTSFTGIFENSLLTATQETGLCSRLAEEPCCLEVQDFFPPPPYFHLLTSFEELKSSPQESLLCALHELPKNRIGFYQCLFQPASPYNNWHQNVELLHDLEYESKLQTSIGSQYRSPQQLPSGNLQGTAMEVDRKAHSDKPFYFATVRIGLTSDMPHYPGELSTLTTFMNVFRHGGKPLQTTSSTTFKEQFSNTQLKDMILLGKSYRPGFLVNSRELAGLVHLFPIKCATDRDIPSPLLETLTIKNDNIQSGTLIGVCEHAGRLQPVHIPPATRDLATHLIASSGMGKSTIMINMFLQDIKAGQGAVFIDAHGDAIQNLLGLIPESEMDRCIYFNPDDPEWIPLWNPLQLSTNAQAHVLADNFVSAFERVSRDWGDRLATILRNGIIGLAECPRSTLLDLFNLARRKTDESEELRHLVVENATDDSVRNFWDKDFLKDYREADLTAVKHKLTRLMPGGTIKAMFSQAQNRIDFRTIMDEGKILFVDLAPLGADSRKLLGSLILTLFHTTALSRHDIPPQERRRFAIYADEAHLFVSADAIESIVTQTRKFGVNLCIANQYTSQFRSQQVDALSSVGTTIMGRLDAKDSRFFIKDLQGKVEVDDLTSLERYEMIARIGIEVVRIKTLPLSNQFNESTRTKIIEQTHANYCISRQSFESERLRRKSKHPVDLNADVRKHAITESDLYYDEF